MKKQIIVLIAIFSISLGILCNLPHHTGANSTVKLLGGTQYPATLVKFFDSCCKNVMWRCGEQGLKISRQRTRNFTERNFHMAENCASLRTTRHNTFYCCIEKFIWLLHSRYSRNRRGSRSPDAQRDRCRHCEAWHAGLP